MKPLFLPLYCKLCGYQLGVLSSEKAMPWCPYCSGKKWGPAGKAREATDDELQSKVDEACSI